MRLITVEQVLFCLANKKSVSYKVNSEEEGYQWTSLRLDPFFLLIDFNTYVYYVDAPLAMWTGKGVVEKYHELMALKDDTLLTNQIVESDEAVDLLFDDGHYCGFVHRKADGRMYHIRMDMIDHKWIGIWEVENV
jgi:hypothetical protein